MAKEQSMENNKEENKTVINFWTGFDKQAGLVDPKKIKKLTKPIFTNLSHEAPKVMPKPIIKNVVNAAAHDNAAATLTYGKWGKDVTYTPTVAPKRSPEEIKQLAQQKAQQQTAARIENAGNSGYTDPQFRRANKNKIGE